jgi:hypothetical protein
MKILFLFSLIVFADPNLDQMRAQKIVDALNASATEWTEQIKIENVKIKNGVGRVDVNTKAKFSYYIFTEFPNDPHAKIILIPMATSRYTPTYYQTDEWWDEHKNEIEEARRKGTPAPRQNMDEVEQWLKEIKLSTNPWVFEITESIKKTRLQSFLLDYYLRFYSKDGVITLYRGGEKPGELEIWTKGETPRGVRYWTPTAAYAWRYARKNRSYSDDLIDKKVPLFKFEIPEEAFRQMVERRWPRLILGTELTKRVHDQFDSAGEFIDQLKENEPYLGEGRLGLEFEIRSNRAGAQEMAQYFKGPIEIREFLTDRIHLVRLTAERRKKQNPENKSAIQHWAEKRITDLINEAHAIELMQKKGSIDSVRAALAKVDSVELSNNDFKSIHEIFNQRLVNWVVSCSRVLQ